MEESGSKEKTFGSMPREDQIALVKEISGLAKECGIDLDVQMYSENVGQLFGQEPKLIQKTILRAEKELPSSDGEKAATFNEKLKPLIEGIKGVSVKVVSKLGAGDMY